MFNKRQFLRMSSSPEPCTVAVDQSRIAGLITEESISGAKVTDLDLLTMPFNKALTLEFRGQEIAAFARNTMRDENNKFVLGVVRAESVDTEQSEPTAAMLINCYVQHGDACVICMPIQIESESQILIQLWDGVQFRVPRTRLIPMSREERFRMLQNPKSLDYTSALYGFELNSPQSSAQNLFEYEFGTYPGCPVLEKAVAATS